MNQIIGSYPWGNYTLELGQIVKHHGEIFDFEYPFYDEAHRPEFERKFLLHFRYNEIGQETLQRFKYMLQDVLTHNYEKYRHTYATWQKAQELPWWDNKNYHVDLSREIDTVGNKNSQTKGKTSNTNTNESKGTTHSQDDTIDSGTNLNKYLDTPQGEISNLFEGNGNSGYLTNATKDESHSDTRTTSEGNSTNSTKGTSNGTNDRDYSRTEDEKHIEKLHREEHGNIGVITQASIVKAWLKDAYIDVDRLIMKDCEELFMQVY